MWRRIEVPSTMKLSELSETLESAMGWLGGHLHLFEASGVVYEPPDDLGFGFGSREGLDETNARVGTVLPVAKGRLRWDYDFGDGWQHDVGVESIEPLDPERVCPICLAGRRACPPEDCGGPWGYANLLEALADPEHDQHGESTEWVGGHFDPDRFDPDEATAQMRAPRLDMW